MNDCTILYYTSNDESESFEKRTKDNILKVTDLPIISVSQKPIDFGDNICVGKQGASGFNMFRQVLIGLKKVKTRFVISAEADCLYPPDYFTWRPETNDCWRNSNLYVIGIMTATRDRGAYYHKPNGATHAQIVGTQYYIDVLEKLFKDAPEWCIEEKNFPKERTGNDDVFDRYKLYETLNPVVQRKTRDSMRWYTSSSKKPLYTIPYWGTDV